MLPDLTFTFPKIPDIQLPEINIPGLNIPDLKVPTLPGLPDALANIWDKGWG